MPRLMLLVLLAVIGLPSLAGAAPIYRCAGAGGATVFSQVPCGKDSSAVGGSSSKSSASSAAFDAIGDKAALSAIDSRCEAQSRKILDDYSARFAEANAKIAGLHKNVMVSGATGAEKDPAVQKQIATVEAEKTELLGSQDREVSMLRNQCEADRKAELQRQSDRDAAHSVARR